MSLPLKQEHLDYMRLEFMTGKTKLASECIEGVVYQVPCVCCHIDETGQNLDIN